MICNCHAYLLTQYPCSLQVLPMGMGKVLQTKGTQVPYHHSGTPKSRKVPSQCDPQPEIQCAHLPTNGKKKVSFFWGFFLQFICVFVSARPFIIFVFWFQVLFQQFKFFLNLYFLVMATSQFIPDIRIGYLYTYWGPLVRLTLFLH